MVPPRPHLRIGILMIVMMMEVFALSRIWCSLFAAETVFLFGCIWFNFLVCLIKLVAVLYGVCVCGAKIADGSIVQVKQTRANCMSLFGQYSAEKCGWSNQKS
ncbi:uncharacterized protein LOC141606797 [Silene latifolia]|uniref:uncharacterized protein LOC141606797 n=1 Tax=Silene latifolia TaxID=37657 RepID=UPI003D780EA2